ncbi:hypothetical protein SLS62_005360 [Diatrype stigma]|uniref:Uncharacterized protein n=1 Tax=Diatrype stigma TaxID=117547 RepID=A0AAN9URC6_9PEZI
MFGVAPFTALTHADHGAYAQRSARMQMQREMQKQMQNASKTSLPFRDDQRLIGLRYDETEQADPPVPIIPARSPLRPSVRSTQPTHRASKSLDCSPRSLSIPLRPSSCVLVPTNARVPPPRPPRPEEPHPALRTITSPGQGAYDNDWNWDSGLAKVPNVPPSQSVWEDSDEEDGFMHERMDNISSRMRIASLRLAPKPKAPSLDSIDESGRRSESSTSQISVPLSSPSLSDSNTLSPTTTSPATPVTEHFSDKLARSFSFRSHKSSKSQSKQLKKNGLKRDLVAVASEGGYVGHWRTGQ